MINYKKILNKNFNYFLIVPYLIWISLIIFYIFNSHIIKAGELEGFVLYGSDSSRYIVDAKKFLELDFSSIHTSKLSYILLITVIFFFKLNLTSLVFFQFISTIISSLCLFLICKKLFSKWVGLICLFFFLTCLPIQLRNFYILTEILFINSSIILTYFCFFKQNHKTLILLISIFILFLRPQGFLIIISLFFTIIIFKKKNHTNDLLLKGILTFISIFLLIFFINLGVQDYDLINSLSRGIIWGYSFDSNSICKKNCIDGFTDPNLYERNVLDFLKYLKDNFLIVIKISFLKIILFFTGWRPYYSNLHNTYIALTYLPIFFLFSIYYLSSKIINPFKIFSIFYIGLSTLLISITFVDWSGRFIMYIHPFMMIFASKALSDLFCYFMTNNKKII